MKQVELQQAAAKLWQTTIYDTEWSRQKSLRIPPGTKDWIERAISDTTPVIVDLTLRDLNTYFTHDTVVLWNQFIPEPQENALMMLRELWRHNVPILNDYIQTVLKHIDAYKDSKCILVFPAEIAPEKWVFVSLSPTKMQIIDLANVMNMSEYSLQHWLELMKRFYKVDFPEQPLLEIEHTVGKPLKVDDVPVLAANSHIFILSLLENYFAHGSYVFPWNLFCDKHSVRLLHKHFNFIKLPNIPIFDHEAAEAQIQQPTAPSLPPRKSKTMLALYFKGMTPEDKFAFTTIAELFIRARGTNANKAFQYMQEWFTYHPDLEHNDEVHQILVTDESNGTKNFLILLNALFAAASIAMEQPVATSDEDEITISNAGYFFTGKANKVTAVYEPIIGTETVYFSKDYHIANLRSTVLFSYDGEFNLGKRDGKGVELNTIPEIGITTEFDGERSKGKCRAGTIYALIGGRIESFADVETYLLYSGPIEDGKSHGYGKLMVITGKEISPFVEGKFENGSMPITEFPFPSSRLSVEQQMDVMAHYGNNAGEFILQLGSTLTYIENLRAAALKIESAAPAVANVGDVLMFRPMAPRLAKSLKRPLPLRVNAYVEPELPAEQSASSTVAVADDIINTTSAPEPSSTATLSSSLTLQ